MVTIWMVNVSVIRDGKEENVVWDMMNVKSQIVAEEDIAKMENAFVCKDLRENSAKKVAIVISFPPK